MMIAAHFGDGPLFWNLIHLQKFIGGAEGFVSYSGLVLGMVASRRGSREENAVLNARILRRAGQILCLHYLLIVSILVLHEMTGRMAFVPSVRVLGGWYSALYMLLTLRFQIDFANILPVYVLFLLCAPALLAIFRRGYTGLCLAASIGLYLVAQVSPSLLRVTDARFGDEAFRLPAWQVLFIFGLSLGFYRRKIVAVWPAWKNWIIPLCLCCYCAVFVIETIHRLSLFGWNPVSPAIEAAYFGRSSLRPIRLLAFASANLLTYLLLRRVCKRETPLRCLLWLSTLGRNSLYCFIAHFGLLLMFYMLGIAGWSPIWHDFAIVLILITIYNMAKHHILSQIIPN